MRFFIVCSLALALGGLGCRSGPPPRPPEGVLQLTLSPPEASVFIDEQPVIAKPGATAVKVSLPAGPRRVEVRAPGYLTAYREALVTPSGVSRLEVALRPDPDGVDEAAAGSAPAAAPRGIAKSPRPPGTQ